MADEVKKDPGVVDQHIGLKIADASGNEVHFRVKPTTPFQKIFNAFCERQGRALGAFRFLFDGKRIEPTNTPSDFDMEDGDRIDAMAEQTGGF